jgi:hypothetical protein
MIRRARERAAPRLESEREESHSFRLRFAEDLAKASLLKAR